jgi:hypothetical protein
LLEGGQASLLELQSRQSQYLEHPAEVFSGGGDYWPMNSKVHLVIEDPDAGKMQTNGPIRQAGGCFPDTLVEPFVRK